VRTATPARWITLRRQVVFGIVGAIVLFAGVEVLWYRNITQLVSGLEWVTRKNRLLSSVDGAFVSLKEAEVAEREFTITGDRASLAAFRETEIRIHDQIRDIAVMSADDPVRTERLHALTPLLDGAFATMRATVALRERGDTAAARARDDSSSHDGRFRTLAAAVTAIDSAEGAEQDTKRAEAGAAVGRTATLTGLAFVLAFVIAGIAVQRTEREITRRRDAERKAIDARDAAERMSQAKSEFLTRVSHELRTPLNSVIGFSNVLLRRTRARLIGQEIAYLERIRANGTHLLSVIDDLLDLSKIESGKERLELDVVLLDRLIAETVAQLEGRLVGKDVALRAELPDAIAPIVTDERKLKQVLINLIGNAVKFTEAGSVTVRVVVDTATSEARRIEVADTGIGIPAQRQAAIFEAFEQADGSDARRYGGTGLGLSIAMSFSHLMGYQLSVASVVGEGSTFTVDLSPGVAVQAPPARASVETPMVTARRGSPGATVA
jgi:signal transduction histidine kinase